MVSEQEFDSAIQEGDLFGLDRATWNLSICPTEGYEVGWMETSDTTSGRHEMPQIKF